jgi:hypothetical protein
LGTSSLHGNFNRENDEINQWISGAPYQIHRICDVFMMKVTLWQTKIAIENYHL